MHLRKTVARSTKIIASATLLSAGFVPFSQIAWGSTSAPPTATVNGQQWVQVSTAAELEYIDNNQSAYLNDNIQLMNDMDVTGFSWVPFGTMSNPFTGTFDGQGHKVTGVSENTATATAGFFGFVKQGSVKNLGVSVSVVASNSDPQAGGLIGYLQYGSVTDCYATGSVTVGHYIAGGLVGTQQGGSIINSHADVTVTGGTDGSGGLVGSQNGIITDSYATGTVSGAGPGGGLVGDAVGGTFTNCYATGSVVLTTSSSDVGGLIGHMDMSGSSIIDCYATGAVSDTNFVLGYTWLGGLIGSTGTFPQTYMSSYFDTTTTTQSSSTGHGNLSGLTGESDANMHQQSTYSGWDFVNTWAISSSVNNGYPYLRAGLSEAVAPNITTQPQSATVSFGATSPSLIVSATVIDGGTLSYQWYSNTTNSSSGGTAISGATNATYAAPTTTAGTTYYYVVVTNTNTSTNTTSTNTSNVAAVTVNAPLTKLSLSASNTTVSTGATLTVQGSVYIENGSSQTPAVNTPVTLSGPAGGSWMSGGQSTTSVVYSVYTSNQGTFSVDWTAPSIPGLYTLSASADMSTNKLSIAVNAVGTITYSGNGATGGTVPVDSNTYTAGASATVLGNSGNLVKTGYTFAGWNTAADGSGTSYAAGSPITFGTSGVTLYAQWKISSSGGSAGGNSRGTGSGPSNGPSSGSSSGASGGSISGGSGGSSSSTGANGSTSGGSANTNSSSSPELPTVVTSSTFTSSGGTIQNMQGNTMVNINVPQGAFTEPETLKVTAATPAEATSWVSGLSNSGVAVVLGVNFSGANPTKPVTVTITNPKITSDAQIYKMTSTGGLIPLQASVSAGKVTVSFTSDPDFVVLNVKPNERVITLVGHVSIVPAIVGNDGGMQTTYMPIWYVMQLLKSMGIESAWNGHAWNLNTSLTANLFNIQSGTGSSSIYINGTLAQRVNARAELDPSTNGPTTYMPIWYVQQILQRFNLASTWNGTTWTVTPKNS